MVIGMRSCIKCFQFGLEGELVQCGEGQIIHVTMLSTSAITQSSSWSVVESYVNSYTQDVHVCSASQLPGCKIATDLLLPLDHSAEVM